MHIDEIKRRFTYHAPDDIKIQHFKAIRANAKHLAVLINDVCPEGREKSTAITKLEEAVMWANASIAREEYPDSEEIMFTMRSQHTLPIPVEVPPVEAFLPEFKGPIFVQTHYPSVDGPYHNVDFDVEIRDTDDGIMWWDRTNLTWRPISQLTLRKEDENSTDMPMTS